MPRKIIGAANDDNSNKPYLSNYPVLKDWLDKRNAQCMWQIPKEPREDDGDLNWTPTAYIEMWLVNRRPVVIVIHGNKHGWEIYSALNSNKIDETFADVEARLGIIEGK